MPRVLITPSVLHNLPGTYRQILEQAGLEVVYPPAGASLFDPAALIQHLQGIDATLASTEPYTEEVLAKSRLRVVARMGVGYDAVDVPAATRHGVAVTITPGANEHSVAELTMALLLGVFRGLPRRIDEVRTGRWTKKTLPRLAGRTMGLVGLGRIGKAVVPRAIGLGLKVIGYDPFADKAFAERHGVELVSLEDLFRRADIVSLHSPATAETANMINARTLALMKPGSVLINTARGGLVDEAALVDALKSGHLLGAGLDVFQVEPLPTDSPLLQLDNVLATPHMAGLDDDSFEAMGSIAARCVAELFQGRWPEGCVVNETIRPGWTW